jgi:hypothetical protein
MTPNKVPVSIESDELNEIKELLGTAVKKFDLYVENFNTSDSRDNRRFYNRLSHVQAVLHSARSYFITLIH